MLFLLIPAAWLTFAAFVVILCRAAARDDTTGAQVAERSHPQMMIGGFVAWDDAPLVAGRLRRSQVATYR